MIVIDSVVNFVFLFVKYIGNFRLNCIYPRLIQLYKILTTEIFLFNDVVINNIIF
jgi:hypothetical protein